MSQISPAPGRISTWFQSMEIARIDPKHRNRARTSFAWQCALIGGLLTASAAPAATSTDSAAPAPLQAQSAATPMAPSQTGAPTQSATPNQPVPPLRIAPPNARSHYPTDCAAYLPPGVARPQTEGATLFSFRLTAQGEMRDIVLFQSSGNADLDNAALACAAAAICHMEPVRVAGKPAEVTWVMGYFWRNRPPTFAMPSPSGQPNLCNVFSYPLKAIRSRAGGTTILSYHIAIDGSEKDLAVTNSSGNADLDKASLDCVSTWRYFPVKQNGQPVQVDKITQVQWRGPR